jgi:hypothetical protein
MATIEALYIFDEHKYVSSLAILTIQDSIMLTAPLATSYSTMSTLEDRLLLQRCSRSTSSSPHRALV